MDMYSEKEPELTNTQKAAVLFITLGPEYSAMLFKMAGAAAGIRYDSRTGTC